MSIGDGPGSGGGGLGGGRLIVKNLPAKVRFLFKVFTLEQWQNCYFSVVLPIHMCASNIMHLLTYP